MQFKAQSVKGCVTGVGEMHLALLQGTYFMNSTELCAYGRGSFYTTDTLLDGWLENWEVHAIKLHCVSLNLFPSG